MVVALSFFLPGFGQIYAKRAERGISILEVFALGKIGDPNGIEIPSKLAEDKDPVVRWHEQ